MKFAGVILSLSALIGCFAINNNSQIEVPIEPDCGASKFEYLIGKNAKSIENLKGLPSGTRIIFPGTATTKDLRLERLNIYINRSNIVEKVICG